MIRISNTERQNHTPSTQGLREEGVRVTNQRMVIMEIIRRVEGHLDANEIYRLARRKEPRLSLSTVYRTLQMLKRQGLIDELHFDEAHHHYEAKPLSEHYHLVCLKCGKVTEFHFPLSRYVARKVAEAKGFDITETEVRVSGYCAECRQKR